MAVTEETRYKIYEAFKASYGDEMANGLIEMFPPAGADVGTKQDLAALEDRIGLRFETLEARFGERLERELRRQSARFTASLFVGLTLFGVVDRLI